MKQYLCDNVKIVHSPEKGPCVGRVGDFNVGFDLEGLFGTQKIHVYLGLLFDSVLIDDEG